MFFYYNNSLGHSGSSKVNQMHLAEPAEAAAVAILAKKSRKNILFPPFFFV